MENLVDHDTRAQDRYDILAFDDVDSITVRPRPIAFTHLRNDSTASLKSKFVLPERSVDRVVVGTGNIQREFFIEPSPFFDDFGEQVPVNGDLVPWFPREEFLADEGQFVSIDVLE